MFGIIHVTLVLAWSSSEVRSWRSSSSRSSAPQAFRRTNYCQMTATDDQRATENILEDGDGHINRDLAERIWSWEEDRRRKENLPKLDYSVRAGLRLVDSIVEENQRGGSNADSSSDLVQEGLTALLDAMGHYRHHEHEDFESYAREHIRQRLATAVDEDARRPLPKAIKSVVKEAKRLMSKRIEAGKPTTWAAVADDMKLPTETLVTYLRLAKRTGTLSVESTVEIMNPMLEDGAPSYRDQDEWELQENKLLDDGQTVRKDELIDEYLDEMIEHEGDDEAWVQREQIAGPLSDIIPDTNEHLSDDNDDNFQADDSILQDLDILQDLIRTDLSSFLDSNLDPDEVKVIRLTFGLDSGTPQSATKTARELGITAHQVADRMASALSKLRGSYLTRFSPDEDDDEVEDSV